MKPFFLFILLSLFVSSCQKPASQSDVDLTTHFESNPNQTVTYEQGIAYWALLDQKFKNLSLVEYGRTDIGKPLHFVIVSSDDSIQSLEELANSPKPLLFINNAIHAGEPCGVDATMLFARDLITQQNSKVLDKINIIAIPFYNIGGVLNRNSTTRTNQNGPEEYGFRGNAKNLDLNRDFIKADSQNAKWFAKAFSLLNPDVFVDNHTTNGADYQHIMTLISSMPEHYQEPLGSLVENKLLPYLYDGMEEKNFQMSPYVYSIGETPFEGIRQFNDLPRYSMGYASLHNTIAFTPETHMLKTYEERVNSTYQLLHLFANWIATNGAELKTARERANKTERAQENYTIQWELDSLAVNQIDFLGYTPKHKESEISGLNRLYYDQSEPKNVKIPFYNKHIEKKSIKKPYAYIIPQAYDDVIDRLMTHGVEVNFLQEDETKEVKAYKIIDYDSRNEPYEFHYLHSNVEVESFDLSKNFYKGDAVVYLDQENQKIILECLEPQAEDSFFAWNFFDGVLQQKEFFSPYVFEDEAAQLLIENPSWQKELEVKKQADPEFAKNSWAQLYFIFQKSNRYEDTHNVYPVYRVE